MSLKVIESEIMHTRCIICLEDYYRSFSSSSSSSFISSSALLQSPPPTTTKRFDNLTTLYTSSDCHHAICQPCLEEYTINTLEERGKNNSVITKDLMKFINCPFPECNQTYSVNEIITKILPFRHRWGIWWRQWMLHKNGPLVSLQKLKKTSDKNDKKKSNTTTTTTTDSTQTHLSKEFLKLALKEGWVRCPNCKYFVGRQAGCRHIKCRCGIQFCYLCGTQYCKKDSCYKNRDNLHAELQSIL